MVSVLDFYDNRVVEKAEAERAAKATPPRKLAVGAKNEDESAILSALREKPSTTMADLERRSGAKRTDRERVAGLNSTAFGIAFRALRDRGLVKETASLLGSTLIIAVD